MVLKFNRLCTKGLPDNSSLSFSARISSLQDMLDVTRKPVVFDADNGGQIEHLPFLVRSLERSGVSAIIMEDKIGLKKILYLKINLVLNKINHMILQKN